MTSREILSGDFLLAYSERYRNVLDSAKATGKDIDWYPYGILNNFIHLQSIFNEFPLNELIKTNFLDIGAADGDLTFMLSSLGYRGTVVEKEDTNFNGTSGITYLNDYLKFYADLQFLDIDSASHQLIANEKYSLTFFLGILYHLKNPVQVLENLSLVSDHLLLSTRVAKFAKDQPIHELKVAYLLGPSESNNDATNWWIFTVPGLLQLFERTGWKVMASKTVGDLSDSNPYDQDHDERYFCLLKSIRI